MTISVIQGTKGRTGSANNIASTGITTSSGSALVAVMVWDTGTFSSLVDSKSNSWTQIGTELTFGTSGRARAYYSELSSVGASHTVTITQTGTSAMSIFVIEVGGGTIPGIADKNAQNSDATSPWGSGVTATTTQANELVTGLFIGNSGSNPATHAINAASTPTSGWSITAAAEETNGASFYTGGIASVRVTATGTYEGQWTETGSAANCCVRTATFNESAGGGAAVAAKILIPTDLMSDMAGLSGGFQ